MMLETSWLLYFSQMPSQPISTNFSCLLMLCIYSNTLFEMSGKEVMICFSGAMLPSFLYSMSPSARERFRLPLTRPSTT